MFHVCVYTDMNCLSADIIYYLAVTYLPYRDIIMLNRTCKQLHQTLFGSTVRPIWKDLFHRDYSRLLITDDYKTEFKKTWFRYSKVRSGVLFRCAIIWRHEMLFKRKWSAEGINDVYVLRSLIEHAFKNRQDEIGY